MVRRYPECFKKVLIGNCFMKCFVWGWLHEGFFILFGWHLDGIRGWVAPTRERAWMLRLALLEICRRGMASGRDIEKLVGHATFIALQRREILSVFSLRCIPL